MFCRAMEIELLGSRIEYALKEPYILVYMTHSLSFECFHCFQRNLLLLFYILQYGEYSIVY